MINLEKYTEADIENLKMLRDKIAHNTANLSDYEEYNDILMKFNLDGEEVLKENKYTDIEDYFTKRLEAKKGNIPSETEGTVLGQFLGLALGVILAALQRHNSKVEHHHHH